MVGLAKESLECITFTGLAYITFMQVEKQLEQNAVQERSVPDVRRTTSKNSFTVNMFPVMHLGVLSCPVQLLCHFGFFEFI